MSENEYMRDGVQYVAKEADTASCAGCAFESNVLACTESPRCVGRPVERDKLIIWVVKK